MKLLATLPFIGILVGVVWVNRPEPLVLGMPPLLAWISFWIVATAVVMGVIYRIDPANRRDGTS